MKKLILASSAIAIVALAGCKEETAPAAEVQLDTLEQKVSYTIGVSVAENVRIDEFAFDSDAFVMAVEDVKAGKDVRLSDEDMRATMQAFQTMQRELAMKESKALGEKNLAEGQAFLEKKASEEGVVKTDSGLMYKVLTEGSGAKPLADDMVSVHYRGTLLDGTEFDSSYSRGEPATFGVSRLIPGWVEALQLMPVGSKWELYVPANLAYGEQGNPSIPPNSTLVFELEVLEIVKPEAPAEAATEEKKEG